MTSTWTISLDLTKWCDYGVGGDSKNGSAKWIRTRELWELQDRVGLIIRSDCSSFRPSVSVTSKGRASVHVYNGAIRIDQFWTVRPRTVSVTSEGRASDHDYYGPVLPDSKRRPGPNSSETSTRSRKLSATMVIKKTFKHEDLQTWRLSDMKIFRHEDIQAWRLQNVMTIIKEGYPSTRRSFNKKIFKLTFTPFCPSLELLSYDITYVIWEP